MRYFTLYELCDSEVARQLRIDNSPNDAVIGRLTRLVDYVLDPLRIAWGKPIIVNSGYRCPALNKAVGGVETSQHLRGEAADITAGSEADNRKLYELAVKLGLPFDQLIGEKGCRWLHISYKSNDNRGEHWIE